MDRHLLILAYHRVLATADPLRPGDITVEAFSRQMAVINRYFNALPLATAVGKLADRSLPRRAVCITFDDGYADNFTVALPVLQRYGLPACVFVASAYLDGGRMWNDTIVEALRVAPGESIDLESLNLGTYEAASPAQRYGAVSKVIKLLKYMSATDRSRTTAALADLVGKPLPDDLMLTSAQLRELHGAGIEIGAHTVSHPILKAIDSQSARREIVDSKQQLEEIIGVPVTSFAYPNGRPGVDYDDAHVEMVREAGYRCAVATSVGVARRSADALQLPRFGPWGESSLRFGVRLAAMHLGR